jgi:hypothetical protein
LKRPSATGAAATVTVPDQARAPRQRRTRSSTTGAALPPATENETVARAPRAFAAAAAVQPPSAGSAAEAGAAVASSAAQQTARMSGFIAPVIGRAREDWTILAARPGFSNIRRKTSRRGPAPHTLISGAARMPREPEDDGAVKEP